MLLEPGTAVGERYRLVKPLARGGMATVWVADDQQREERVAVKFLSKDVAEDGDIRARFSREATAKLDSPHIVQLFDHGALPDDTPYIVMELLDGEDLGTRLEREGRLPLSQLSHILEQMARGLEVAHAAGIVHRDIKPDNIFLVKCADGSEQIKLLDFGIAKHTAIQTHSVVTATGTMLGTPGYMSPEQVLTGSRIDWRSDLWSMGVVSYHAMTGEIPFDGATLGALCVAITRGRFLAPRDRVATLPEALDAWMQRALALDPDDRFGSAEEMATTFRAAVAGVAPEPSRSQLGTHDTVKEVVAVVDGSRHARAPRWWVFVLVAVAAAVLGGLVVAQVMPSSNPNGSTATTPDAVSADPSAKHAQASSSSSTITTDSTAAPAGSAAPPDGSADGSATPPDGSAAQAHGSAAPNTSATAAKSAAPRQPAPQPPKSSWRPPQPPPPPPPPPVKDRGF